MLRNLKNIAVISLATVFSRVLGLVRDILLFAALGAGVWNSAFILAFTLPNLFRRLLGEGALTSAVVPVFSDVLAREGREGTFVFFNRVALRLGLVLVVVVAAGMAVLGFFAEAGRLPERWVLGAELGVILFPYMLFICLAALAAAALNVLGRFGAPAASPILLNGCLIAALVLGLWRDWEPATIVYGLSAAVLVGGALQLAVPAWDLARQGWRPRSGSLPEGDMGELVRLFLPGLLGAAILQVNIMVSRLLAHSLDDSAVSELYLASRLMELPLGIFTVAVATVFFPLLSRYATVLDDFGFADSLARGMRLVVGVSFPAGVGLAVLAGPVLELLFRWGAFDQAAVRATVPLILIYGLGLPFYSAATFATRGLHATKDMKSPVRVAALCLAINAGSGLLLMNVFGAAGLAAANVLAAVAQALLLWRVLSGSSPKISYHSLRSAFAKILLAGLIMGLFCWMGREMGEMVPLSDKWRAGLVVGLCVPGGAGLYFGLLVLFRFEDLGTLTDLVRRLFRLGGGR